MAIPYPTNKFGRSAAGSRITELWIRGAPPSSRAGRRAAALRSTPYDLDTSLDDEWMVRIGHAPRRIRAGEIRARCRTEKFARRSAHDRSEMMDQVRLIGKAAGICDIGPAKAAFPCGDDLLDPCQSRILLRAGAVCRTEAARQLPLADIQERGEFSHAQARSAAQPRGSAGKNRILAILTQILKKKTFDAGDPFAAAAGLHHPFLQQGDIVILENVAQSDLDVHEFMHRRPRQPGGALGL